MPKYAKIKWNENVNMWMKGKWNEIKIQTMECEYEFVKKEILKDIWR